VRASATKKDNKQPLAAPDNELEPVDRYQRWTKLGVLLSIGLVVMLLYGPAEALAKACCSGGSAAVASTSFSFAGAAQGETYLFQACRFQSLASYDGPKAE
jgi:hypothetical protein